MFLRIATLAIALVALGSADTLTLRSGQVLHGQYVGGDARHIRFAVGDRVETYLIDDVDSLKFGSGQARNNVPDRSPVPDPAQPVAPDDPPPPVQAANQPAPQPQAPPPAPGPQISVGTVLTVRMIDAVDSDQSRLGQTFRASVDERLPERKPGAAERVYAPGADHRAHHCEPPGTVSGGDVVL